MIVQPETRKNRSALALFSLFREFSALHHELLRIAVQLILPSGMAADNGKTACIHSCSVVYRATEIRFLFVAQNISHG